MISSRAFIVTRKEMKTILTTKGFVVGTILMPLIMIILGVVNVVFFNVENDRKTHVTIVSHDTDYTVPLEQVLKEAAFVKSLQYTVEYKRIPEVEFKDFLLSEKQSLLDDPNRGIFLVPNDAVETKKVVYYSSNTTNQDVRDKLSNVLNQVVNITYFKDKAVNLKDIQFAEKSVDITGLKVTASGSEAESWGGAIVAMVLGTLMLSSIFGNAVPCLNVSIEDKQNRVVEVLISTLNPRDLMTGKLIAWSVTSAGQMAVWVMCFVLVSKFFPIPEKMRMDIPPMLIAYFLFNFFIAIATFQALYGGLGSMFDNLNDANSMVWPIFLLILIPYYSTFTVVRGNPANSLSEILSMMPFTSLYVMPARLALIEVPTWQLFVSIMVNFSVLALMYIAVGKLYRVGVLLTGVKPTFGEIIKWLRVS